MRRNFILVVAVISALCLQSRVQGQSKTRKQVLDEIVAKRKELSTLEEEFLSVSEADRSALATLLSQPDTGVIRLLPREVFDSEVYKQQGKTLTVRGGGAYYSFARLTHEYGYGSDIQLDNDYISVGFAGADYGLLLKLGSVQLEELSANHPLVMPLARYNPAGSEPDARVEQRRFSDGTELDGLAVRRRVPVEVGTSYLLRSISYNCSDVLVAIRVAREDTDGSIIVAWKLLRKYPKPRLARNN